MTTTASETAHVQVVKVSIPESVERVALKFITVFLVTVGILVAIIGACGVVMGLNLSAQASLQREFQRDTDVLEREFRRDTESTNKAVELMQRQSRMTELKLDDWTVVAHRSGLVLPDDYTRGPQGNPDAESFNIKPKGK